MNNRIGVIVDGPGDYAALRSRFGHFRILKTDGPRGHSPSVSQIVSTACKQLTMLQAFGCNLVVVVTDFEARTCSYRSFVDQLSEAFAGRYSDFNVAVAVPNWMIENWYLADIAYLSTKKVFLRKVKKQKSYEGKNGKKVLRRLFHRKYNYNEVKHGAELFAILRFDRAKKLSESLKDFLSLLS
ncbi:MAG: DUF4276 family protein [Thermodesulfobacteriota bacterium]